VNDAQVMNLGHLLTQTARLFPDRPSLVQEGGHTWTWSETERRVAAMTAALRGLGVRKGDRILVQSRNNVQMFESCWVAFRLGCVWVPTNFRLTPPEVAYLGASSGANTIIFEEVFSAHADAVRAASSALKHVIVIGRPRAGEFGYEDLLREHRGAVGEPETVDADDPLWFFYTSGTTGRPKAGVLTHGQMAFVVTNHLADLIPGTTERDCSIAVAPLSHGAGIHALLNVARGAPTVLLASEKLDPEAFWQAVEKHRISNLFTVPTIVKLLVEHPAVDMHDHSSLRYLIYAGAPMYRSDQKLALQKLGKVLVQYFGLGEVTGSITVLPTYMHSADDDDPDALVGCCGRARTGMEVSILDSDLEVGLRKDRQEGHPPAARRARGTAGLRGASARGAGRRSGEILSKNPARALALHGDIHGQPSGLGHSENDPSVRRYGNAPVARRRRRDNCSPSPD